MALRRAGLLVAALALAWLVLVRGYADYLARTNPERALALNPAQPEALATAAQRALLDKRMDEAGAFAARALRRQPLEGRALRILGAVAEAQQDRPRALALMRLAAATTPRDVTAQFWLAINALYDRDVDGALRRLDRLLRFEPEIQGDAFPILGTIALNAAGAPTMATYLIADPPWRGEFMRALIGQSASSMDLSRLFRAIEARGGRLSDAEMDAYAGRLLAMRDWPRLRRWIKRMSADANALVHDGGFDGGGRPPFLGWSIGKVAGADVLIAAEGSGNRALRLVFHDRRVPFNHVSQWLLLQPGNYRLSGRVRLLKLETALGLSWSLSCADSNVVLGKSPRMLGSSDWRDFDFGFVVPPADCGAQLLSLGLDARIAAEQQVVGEAWFDDLAVVGADATPPAR